MAEGPKLVAEAIASGARIDDIFLDRSASSEALADLAARGVEVGARVHDVEPGVLQRVSDTAAPQPVSAVVGFVDRPLASLGLDAGPVLVCVDLSDPGNAGTVLRSAAAAGAAGVVFCAGAVDVYNPKAVRASAGGVFRVPVVTGIHPQDAIGHLSSIGMRVVATVARGGRDYAGADLASPFALLLGGESRGLPPAVAELTTEHLTIPMAAGTESLNVAMAATVLCFESARQRRGAA